MWRSLRPPQPAERSGKKAESSAALRGRKLSGRQLEQAHSSHTQLSRTSCWCQGHSVRIPVAGYKHQRNHIAGMPVNCSKQGSQAPEASSIAAPAD